MARSNIEILKDCVLDPIVALAQQSKQLEQMATEIIRTSQANPASTSSGQIAGMGAQITERQALSLQSRAFVIWCASRQVEVFNRGYEQYNSVVVLEQSAKNFYML